ncbi:cell division protein ZapA [Tsuneonella sp. HG249]
MSEVSLQIGGRTYRVACAPGEEAQVKRLGATIADKLAALGNPTGPDSQNLLFAALLLADEVHEARENGGKLDRAEATPLDAGLQAERDRLIERVSALESEQAGLESAQRDAVDAIAAREAEVAALERQVADLRAAAVAAPTLPISGAGSLAELAPALEHFADILEECADKLERRGSAS